MMPMVRSRRSAPRLAVASLLVLPVLLAVPAGSWAAVADNCCCSAPTPAGEDTAKTERSPCTCCISNAIPCHSPSPTLGAWVPTTQNPLGPAVLPSCETTLPIPAAQRVEIRAQQATGPPGPLLHLRTIILLV